MEVSIKCLLHLSIRQLYPQVKTAAFQVIANGKATSFYEMLLCGPGNQMVDISPIAGERKMGLLGLRVNMV